LLNLSLNKHLLYCLFLTFFDGVAINFHAHQSHSALRLFIIISIDQLTMFAIVSC